MDITRNFETTLREANENFERTKNAQILKLRKIMKLKLCSTRLKRIPILKFYITCQPTAMDKFCRSRFEVFESRASEGRQCFTRLERHKGPIEFGMVFGNFTNQREIP